ncbi:cytochrome P450 2J4-like [Haliotis rufescens]|uniref:cytochrome P450 2J4-like n=1 Tax=Haliotis rufescens TaxID=6454 RepID=UPI00201F79B7|nr:cytochrome P450 2J4-like [Haliotis rufescens]
MFNPSSAATLAATTLLVGLLLFNTSLVVVFITVFLLIWLSTRRPPGLPPGPPLLPIVGNILSMDADPRVTFSKLRRQYGDIFSVYIFNRPLIVLSGYNVIKDALVKNGDVFSDRPYSFMTDFYAGRKGIVHTSGSNWKQQRKFALSSLREFGMGKSFLEANIQEELSDFMKVIEDMGGDAFECKRLVHNAMANTLCSMCFGKRFEYTDPRFLKFLKMMDEMCETLGTGKVLNLFPEVRYLPGDVFSFKKLMNMKHTIDEEEIIKNIEEHIDNVDVDNVDDFITAYFREMRRRGQGDEAFDMGHLKMSMFDLFIGGTETTGTTIRWTLLYFLHYPEVQEKCFREIQEHIGLSRRPSMKDKTSLNYVTATITEVQRCSDIVPTGIPHSVSKDVLFHGYTFPKGVTVITDLESVLQDPAVWGDPKTFRPDRFLDDARKYQKREECIPFSLGRRKCLGESFAQMELFLFITSIIQRFHILPDKGTLPPLKGIIGITNAAPNFNIRAVPRDC